jgi:hypothetical protein
MWRRSCESCVELPCGSQKRRQQDLQGVALQHHRPLWRELLLLLLSLLLLLRRRRRLSLLLLLLFV